MTSVVHNISMSPSIQAYLSQAKRFKNANVGLYGIGVQCHFGQDQAPDPFLIKVGNSERDPSISTP